MPALRAASARLQPSRTRAIASIRRDAATSLLRAAVARSSAGPRSIRVTEIAISQSLRCHHGSESDRVASNPITIESTRQAAGISPRFIRSTDQPNETLGRSRGGLGTRIVGVCDASGRLVDFVLVAGQAHELAPS